MIIEAFCQRTWSYISEGRASRYILEVKNDARCLKIFLGKNTYTDVMIYRAKLSCFLYLEPTCAFETVEFFL